MQRDRQLELLDRIMAHRAAGGTTDLAPDMYTNPVDTYIDPGRYQLEVDQLFAGLPIVACLTADVANPGDYVTLSITDVPILVTRGEDSLVRAFRNVCRHRGVCVAEGRGNGSTSFTCPFHGWSYRLDGQLINPTHRSGFEGIERDAHGLAEMACDETSGVVFVQIDAAPGTIDAKTWVAGMATELAPFDLSGYSHFETRVSTWSMNWKLMFDTFCEIYHVRHLHKASLDPSIHSDNALFDAFGHHGRMVVPRRSIDELDIQARDDWQLVPNVILNYMIVPNTVLVYQQDHVELFQILPTGPDQTAFVTTLYSPEPAVS